MIEFILSVLGGYLIGDSMKSSFADGGIMADGGSVADKIRLREIDRQIREQLKTIKEFEEDDTEREYDRFGNPAPPSWNQQVVIAAEENLNKLIEEKRIIVQKLKLMPLDDMMADGGKTTVVDVIDSSKGRPEYELYEMVVLSLENGSTYVDRFLVSAKDIKEAKQIATDLWEKDAEQDAVIKEVMSEDRYRMFYLNK